MSTASGIDSQIKSYLRGLNEQQKQALLVVAKTFAEESGTKEPAYTDDFIAELDRRTRSLEKGETEGISWDEVRQKARLAVKTKSK